MKDYPSPKLLTHTIVDAFDPETGLLNSLRFAKVLGLSIHEIATILHRTPRGIAKNPASTKIQDHMTRLMIIYQLLLEVFHGSNHHVRIWLRAPHPTLSGRTPLSVLKDGQLNVIESFLHSKSL